MTRRFAHRANGWTCVADTGRRDSRRFCHLVIRIVRRSQRVAPKEQQISLDFS